MVIVASLSFFSIHYIGNVGANRRHRSMLNLFHSAIFFWSWSTPPLLVHTSTPPIRGGVYGCTSRRRSSRNDEIQAASFIADRHPCHYFPPKRIPVYVFYSAPVNKLYLYHTVPLLYWIFVSDSGIDRNKSNLYQMNGFCIKKAIGDG